MYSSAFRRLANVTQVVAADEIHVFHNRLTHSLQVAQVARRIAERLLRRKRRLIGISPDVCEAAALAHDLGHPPFGHIAEKKLNQLALGAGLSDGYEGNAQSFRIVTKLASRDLSCDGLDLTRATLDAVQKYPWLKDKNKTGRGKWGAYDSEKEQLLWARALHQSGDVSQCLEAAIMDWADDVTYSVHDAEDFYRAGLVPLNALGTSSTLRTQFCEEVIQRTREDWPEGWKEGDLIKIFEVLAGAWKTFAPYQGTQIERKTLKMMSSELIGGYVNAVKIETEPEKNTSRIEVPKWKRIEVFMLKQLTWHYVILNPALASQQRGQENVIEGLFEVYKASAWDANDKLLRLFPHLYREKLSDQREAGASLQQLLRTVIDFISNMTERQAIEMHHRLNGVALGSALVHSVR